MCSWEAPCRNTGNELELGSDDVSALITAEWGTNAGSSGVVPSVIGKVGENGFVVGAIRSGWSCSWHEFLVLFLQYFFPFSVWMGSSSFPLFFPFLPDFTHKFLQYILLHRLLSAISFLRIRAECPSKRRSAIRCEKGAQRKGMAPAGTAHRLAHLVQPMLDHLFVNYYKKMKKWANFSKFFGPIGFFYIGP